MHIYIYQKKGAPRRPLRRGGASASVVERSVAFLILIPKRVCVYSI
jgi:hypothetical protein